MKIDSFKIDGTVSGRFEGTGPSNITEGDLEPGVREYTDEKTGIVIRARGMKVLAFVVDGIVVTPSSLSWKSIFTSLFYVHPED